jgi:hypothetical protein
MAEKKYKYIVYGRAFIEECATREEAEDVAESENGKGNDGTEIEEVEVDEDADPGVEADMDAQDPKWGPGKV